MSRLDDGWMAASGALDTFRDPKTRLSEEPFEAPLNRVTGTMVPFWTWLEQPGQEDRLRRFTIAMQDVTAMQPADAILNGKDCLRSFFYHCARTVSDSVAEQVMIGGLCLPTIL